MRLRAALGMIAAVGMAVASLAHAIEEPGVPGCDPAAKRRVVGFVTAVSGSAFAENPACPSTRRPIECGEVLLEGERVQTLPEGRAAFLARSVEVRMDTDSELVVSLRKDGAPDLLLLRGHARVTDGRRDGSSLPHRIATRQAETFASGTDTEAFVSSAPSTSSSMLCEWATRLDVARIDHRERVAIEPGECAIAGAQAPLRVSTGQASALVIADAAQCAGNAADRFNPNDVAAGGEGFEPGPPANQGPSPDCTIGGPCVQPLPPDTNPPSPPIVPTQQGVIESAPVFRPPPGLPVRVKP